MQEKTLRGKVLQKVLEVLNRLPYPKLEINKRKVVFGSKAHRRMITGLILSNDGMVSLGRDRKRLIRAQIHHFINGKLSDQERKKLHGMLAFAHDIEPDFVKRMEGKYSLGMLQSI
jgi:retron-type reverse transcriptase